MASVILDAIDYWKRHGHGYNDHQHEPKKQSVRCDMQEDQDFYSEFRKRGPSRWSVIECKNWIPPDYHPEANILKVVTRVGTFRYRIDSGGVLIPQ